MCGIVGIVGPDPNDHARLEVMTGLMQHRGPDSSGYLTGPPVSLGHRRLAILDLSAAGNQPMTNEDGSLHLVCNGEIYNYQELAADLVAKGHCFSSRSDSEVLLHLYEERGEQLLEGVNGMFAFLLWDTRRQKLLAAVDRFGKKPLYYAHVGERLILASEMKSLLEFPWLDRSLDLPALDRYLSLRHVPAPFTPFRGIAKLEPATLLVWHQGQSVLSTWWRPSPAPALGHGNADAALDAFQALLHDAVRLRLISDVPVGFYLSGGFDSTTIAVLAREQALSAREAFTVGFGNQYDEHEAASRVAGHLGLDFHALNVEPGDFSHMDRIVWHLDEPLGDLITLPAYLLAQAAKQRVTVVLTGDGADEILAGYLHQKIMIAQHRQNSWLKLPGVAATLGVVLGHTPSSWLDRMFDYPDRFGNRERDKLVEVASKAGDWATCYEALTSWFTPWDKSALYTPEFALASAGEPLAELYRAQVARAEGFSLLSRLGLLDLRWWLPFILLYRLDKMAMAHAVETRSPFLDYRVVEAALNLPDALKLSPKRGKEILFRMHRRLLPESLGIHRKQAFYMPFLARHQTVFRAWTHEMVGEQRVKARGFFRWDKTAEIHRQAEAGSMLANRQLVALAQLEHWCSVFIS
ncbi:MAG: asparagine synthase (glutamine-hydrolyzing) [Magnetococcus sp. YQC-5]